MARECTLPINYTGNVPDLGALDWESQPYFTYSLFRGLHEAANASLQWIFPNHEDYAGYRINPDDLLDFTEDSVDVDEMIWKNRGPLAFACIGLILAALVTLFGIGWCCMKCCSILCCSRKSKGQDRYDYGSYDSEPLDKFGYEKRKEKRIRICCGVTLIVWLILSLAFLISLFTFNDQLKDGIDDITNDLQLSLGDAELYLQTTQEQVDGVLIVSYEDLSEALNCVLNEMGVPPSMNSTILKFQQLNTLSKQVNEEELQRNLNLTIETLSEYCTDNVCEDGEDLTKNLSLMVSSLGEIGILARNFQEFSTQSLPKLSSVDKQLIIINTIREDIAEQGRLLTVSANTLKGTLDDVLDNVRKARLDLKEVEDEFDRVNPPLYASILVIILFLVLVSILFLVGAVFSFFGKSSTCFTKARSYSLSCGLILIFIFGGILWIFTMASFLLSGLVTQVVPANLRFLEQNSTEVDPHPALLGKVGTKVDAYVMPNYGFIARNCREGHSAYVTFNFSQVYDISTVKDLETILQPPTMRLQNMSPSISEAVKDILVASSTFTVGLQNSQTRVGSLAGELAQMLTILTKLANRGADDGSKSILVLNSVNTLEKVRSIDLPALKVGLDTIHTVFSSAVADLSKINSNVQETPGERFTAYVANYSGFAYDEIYYNVGECEPMYNALNSTINLFTYKIGSPIAGFWFSLNIIMLLFFPSIITAVILQRL